MNTTTAGAKSGSRSRIGRNLNVWISEELYDALDTLRDKTRRTITAEVELALEQYLQVQGLWPHEQQ